MKVERMSRRDRACTRHDQLRALVEACNNVTLALLLLCCGAGCNASSSSSIRGRFDRLFVIGDSFVDIGNRDPVNSTYTAIGRVNQNWKPPYGRTRPGLPAGRFSDGEVLSDLLADYMGLTPIPYRLLSATSPLLPTASINFAVSGSGVFPNEGFATTSDQITQLKTLLKQQQQQQHASPNSENSFFAGSLIFYVVSGNDYAAQLRNNGSTDAFAGIAFVKSVVEQMRRDLVELCEMGFRSFLVGKLPPVGCMPFATVTNGFEHCEETYNVVSSLHNVELRRRVRKGLLGRGSDVVFLDNERAFAAILYNASTPDRLKACCNGVQSGALCGDVNEAGDPLSSVCGSHDTHKFFWWDEFHPTEASWGVIFDLFLQGFPFLYTDGRSLSQFLGIRESPKGNLDSQTSITGRP